MGTFAENFKNMLMEEFGSFNFMSQQPTLPLQTQDFPQTASPVVTTGETIPMGDVQPVQQSTQDPSILGEIGSLLVTIGFILQNAGIIGDKFDTAQVLTFLNDNYAQQYRSPELAAPVDDGATPEPTSCSNTETSAIEHPMGTAFINEHKLMFENFIKKYKK